MNLSMCGCGFLGIYHLGAVKAFVSHGQPFLSQLQKVSGASAGALIAAVLVCEPALIEECKTFTLSLAVRARKKPMGALTPGFNIMEPLQTFLENSMPHNSYLKATGILHLSLTNIQTKKNEVFNEYTSNHELIQCLLASCFIPVYGGLRPPVVRGKKYIDGGMTNNLYVFEDGRTVTVSPFSGRQDVCPPDKLGKGWFMNQANQDFQVNRNNLLRGIHALFPPSERVLLQYYERGFRDAVRFLKKEGLYVDGTQNPPQNDTNQSATSGHVTLCVTESETDPPTTDLEQPARIIYETSL